MSSRPRPEPGQTFDPGDRRLRALHLVRPKRTRAPTADATTRQQQARTYAGSFSPSAGNGDSERIKPPLKKAEEREKQASPHVALDAVAVSLAPFDPYKCRRVRTRPGWILSASSCRRPPRRGLPRRSLIPSALFSSPRLFSLSVAPPLGRSWPRRDRRLHRFLRSFLRRDSSVGLWVGVASFLCLFARPGWFRWCAYRGSLIGVGI